MQDGKERMQRVGRNVKEGTREEARVENINDATAASLVSPTPSMSQGVMTDESRREASSATPLAPYSLSLFLSAPIALSVTDQDSWPSSVKVTAVVCLPRPHFPFLPPPNTRKVSLARNTQGECALAGRYALAPAHCSIRLKTHKV